MIVNRVFAERRRSRGNRVRPSKIVARLIRSPSTGLTVVAVVVVAVTGLDEGRTITRPRIIGLLLICCFFYRSTRHVRIMSSGHRPRKV